jgi:diguanylate cyclase (GGDEF)-like protein
MALSADQLDLLGEALDYSVSALDSAQRSGQPVLQCLALSRLSRAYTRLNNPARGIELGRQALALAEAAGDRDQIFRALTMFADAHSEEGEMLAADGKIDEARARFGLAYESFDRAKRVTTTGDNPYRRCIALVNRGQALAKTGRLHDALQELDVVRSLARQHGFGRILLAEVEMRALALIGLERPAEARQLCEAALADPLVAGNEALAPELQERLYQACKAQGDLAAALRHHELLLKLQRRKFRRRSDAQLRVLLARAEIERSRAEAQRAAHEAQAERERALVLQAERDSLQHKAQQLRRDAHLDVLTGLPNRRALELRLQQQLRAAPAAGLGCLAIIDVDHFKSINDAHGHARGDEVLRALGALLAHGIREPDFIARWGGEEFVALLHGATPQQAYTACERLRQSIAAHHWSGIVPALTVSASIGVHALAVGASLDQTMAGADRALYAAKNGGRNRVVLGGAAPGDAP